MTGRHADPVVDQGAPHALGTATVKESVELAVLERSGFIESRHAGSAVVVAPDGSVLTELGSPGIAVYPRSCMKPFQAIAALDTGIELDPVQTVLATASHAGTPQHVEVVESVLRLAGLDEDALGCPPDWPGDSAARSAAALEGGPRRVFMNCSGKHAAMLLACVHSGWDVGSYLELDHPLQERVRETVVDFTGEPIVHTGIDGCGAPVHAMSLTALARGIGRVRSAREGSAARLTASVLANGWAIDGHGRANTVVIDELGVLAKLGAEGVMVMAAEDGTAVAVKMLDGSLRAASLVALTLLERRGAVASDAVARVRDGLDLVVTGGGLPVGTIRVSDAV